MISPRSTSEQSYDDYQDNQLLLKKDKQAVHIVQVEEEIKVPIKGESRDKEQMTINDQKPVQKLIIEEEKVGVDNIELIDTKKGRRGDQHETVGVLEYVRYQEVISFLNKYSILKKLASNRSNYLLNTMTKNKNRILENSHQDVALTCLNLSNQSQFVNSNTPRPASRY